MIHIRDIKWIKIRNNKYENAVEIQHVNCCQSDFSSIPGLTQQSIYKCMCSDEGLENHSSKSAPTRRLIFYLSF